MTKVKIVDLPTYIYIDGSNIRLACRKSCGFDLDFRKLYAYFTVKYQHLVRAQYFEGVGIGDSKKEAIFRNYEKYGYEVVPLIRKCYTSPAKYKTFKCCNCGTENKVKIADKMVVMKSNVDVLLCSKVMSDVARNKATAHFIVVSGDGDYAEMIKQILVDHPDAYVSVLSTPYQKYNNYLSTRFKELLVIPHFNLLNILTIPRKYLPSDAPRIIRHKQK
jgi:hypothetical protein